MRIETVLQVGRYVGPFIVGTARPAYERIALWRGRDGLDAFEERDGQLIYKGYRADAPPASTMSRVLKQLGADFRSPLSLGIIAFIALTILAGVVGHNSRNVWFGGLLACGYVFLFVTNLRTQRTRSSDMFEASLVSVKPPIFMAYGVATLDVDGKSFQTGVPWRPVEAYRRRHGTVKLVFVGTPDNPMFVGFAK
jgi:hypothetical protein